MCFANDCQLTFEYTYATKICPKLCIKVHFARILCGSDVYNNFVKDLNSIFWFDDLEIMSFYVSS